MGFNEMAAAFGALSLAVLAILFAMVWRSLKVRWSLFLTLSFAVNAAYYLRVVAGYYVEPLAASPQPGNAALVLLGLVLCTAGLLDYVGVARNHARWFNRLAIGVASLTLCGVLGGMLTRRAGLTVWGAYLLAWALLFTWAMLREPRRGHGLVMLALASYPAIVVAVLLGALSPKMLITAHALPMAVLGMTLLTTGLLRAQGSAAREQKRAEQELLARNQAEAELQLANDTLEQRVNLRTAELRETIEGLESFNRSISHDLRGPLGGIVGVAKLARDYVLNGDAVAAQRMLQAIASQAETSEKLVSALLALARSSDASLNKQQVDTGALVREVVESMRHVRTAAVLPVVVGWLPHVDADPELSRQVFVNLIGNALKFAVGASQPRIEVGVTGDPDAPVFFVRDNGVGFRPEEANRLFKPFQRLHSGYFEGFGVGLSIVKRIVERHGGKVWAEGCPGRGATFYFTLDFDVQSGGRNANDRAVLIDLGPAANQPTPAHCDVGAARVACPPGSLSPRSC